MIQKLIMIFAVGFLAAQASAAEPPALKNRNDKMSYGFGVDVGRT